MFIAQIVRGQAAQVRIDQPGQLFQGALGAVMPLVQPEGDAFECRWPMMLQF